MGGKNEVNEWEGREGELERGGMEEGGWLERGGMEEGGWLERGGDGGEEGFVCGD